jgi:hypothetical protein
MATIQSSDLDFNTIKTNLKTYLQAQSEFADYDFEASGLSNILDVLAYNTHINGLIANFATNESFLNTAQLRSSVVSHAEVLGYFPRSKTAARATVNLNLTVTDAGRPSSITLPAYTTFTTSIEDATYTFQTLENYIATDDGSGNYSFLNSSESANIEIVEGTLRTKTFIVGDVGDGQVYVIPDDTMDTTTMKVDVYDTVSGSSFTVYTNLTRAVRITSTSTIYQVKEAPNGYFEVIFGDGSVLGQQPSPGNKIVITYLSTSADLANGGSIFTASNDVDVNGTDYPLSTTLVSASTGGAAKETISSIKNNATIAFASQQRMVTAEDYKAQILANYNSYITDVNAWGGNQNNPPVYGRVYVSLKFIDGLTDSQKQNIKDQIVTNLTNNLAIMSIDTVFSDPTNVYLELGTTFNFDPDLTNLTGRGIETLVTNTINTYFTTNLKRFDKVFRRSSLLTEIDKLSPAILNSKMDVKVQLRLSPTLGTARNYNLYFPVSIASPDSISHKVVSSRFTYQGTTCVIRNVLGSNVLQVQTLVGTPLVTNVGSYTASTGTISLIAFNPSAIEGTEMKFSVIPANESTIRPLRSYVIDIDSGLSFARAIVDYQNTLTTLA